MDAEARDTRDANELTALRSADQLELQLGHLCNNRCVFCVSGQFSERGITQQMALEPVIAALDDAARNGVRRVTFLGGEPTLQKSFLPALRHAVKLGFDEIVIFTNGVTAATRSYVEKVVALGRFTWRFSIQGGTEEAHDAVTNVPGSFARIIAGLTTLKELGERVTANMCVNERSYRSLPHYPGLVREFDIRNLHIDMVRPAQTGNRTDEYLQSIVPRFSDMAPYIRTMLERFEERDPNFDVTIGNLPYCILPEWSHRIRHGGQLTALRATDCDAELKDEGDKYGIQKSDMVYAPQCDRCALRSDCRGVPSKYAQFYGLDELRPLSARELRAMSRDPRVFVRVVDELLGPILESEPPAPWKKTLVAQRTHDGLVEVTYRHARGEATFVFSRTIEELAGAATRLWETQHYCVSFAADRESPELRTLLGWLHGALRIPVQSRIASCVDRIRNASLTDGWHYDRSEPDVASLGVTAVLRSDDGGRVGVTIAPQSDDDSAVRVTFDVGGVEPLHARHIVEHVSAALHAPTQS